MSVRWLNEVVEAVNVHRQFVTVWQRPVNRKISTYVDGGRGSRLKKKFWHFFDAQIRKEAGMESRNTTKGPNKERVFMIERRRWQIEAINHAVAALESKINGMNIPPGRKITYGEFEELFLKILAEETSKMQAEAMKDTPLPEASLSDPVPRKDEKKEVKPSTEESLSDPDPSRISIPVANPLEAHSVVKELPRTGRKHMISRKRGTDLNSDAGEALHGTLVYNESAWLGIIIGKRYLICRDGNNEEIFRKSSCISCAMIEGPHAGMTGKFSLLQIGFGDSCAQVTNKWLLNPTQIGSYKHIADEIARSVPVLIYGVGKSGIVYARTRDGRDSEGDAIYRIKKCVGVPFTKELEDRLIYIASRTDRTLMKVGLRSWIRSNIDKEEAEVPEPGPVPVPAPSSEVEVPKVETTNKGVETKKDSKMGISEKKIEQLKLEIRKLELQAKLLGLEIERDS